jgi:transcriptional regulator with XRE-family HTH domain
MEIVGKILPSLPMIDISGRLRERMNQLGLRQNVLAARVGITPQRLNNYLNRKGTMPDIEVLSRLATALHVSSDYLLGINGHAAPTLEPLIARFLELAGINPKLAATIGSCVLEATQALEALPEEGDPAMRARVAAQLVWQQRAVPKLGK